MRFRKTLAGFAIGMLMAVGLSTPAKAAYNDCYNYPGTVCLYAFTNYGNPIWRQYPSQINGCRFLGNDGWNDVTTVAWNRTSSSYTLRMWRHYPCGGSGNAYYDLPSGYWVDFSGTPGWDNSISAVQIIAY